MARRGRGRVTVRITGRDRLRERLEDLPEDIKAALTKGVTESSEAVRDDTKRGVRVGEGTLRDNVGIEYEDDGLAATVGWHDDKHYYAAFHERGTRRFPAQPALGPALERERQQYRARLTAEVRAVLR
ncbi:HK97-gp10 family putative phage morphogenesis protein [Streptomyces ipomoeae]|uniref:HK97-gp10 family putative phage morphogenesis protein n=1 Tax=Streptomyces ipomoeae TaxID=103232 RepID=UPI0015F07E85|nr:HK97-gp10 family putative phage morphogenesis protein [Streptomyces ipomoeae]